MVEQNCSIHGGQEAEHTERTAGRGMVPPPKKYLLQLSPWSVQYPVTQCLLQESSNPVNWQLSFLVTKRNNKRIWAGWRGTFIYYFRAIRVIWIFQILKTEINNETIAMAQSMLSILAFCVGTVDTFFTKITFLIFILIIYIYIKLTL